jgi:hypothetical protein
VLALRVQVNKEESEKLLRLRMITPRLDYVDAWFPAPHVPHEEVEVEVETEVDVA